MHRKGNALLSIEILTEILHLLQEKDYYHHLFTAASVCRLWNQIATPFLYYRLSVSRISTMRLLARTLSAEQGHHRYCELVREVDLSCVSQTHDIKGEDVFWLESLRGLERANLMFCPVDDELLDALATNSPGLLELRCFNNSRLTGRGLRALARKCKRLERLSLGDCLQVKGCDITEVVSSTEVRELELLSVNWLEDTSLLSIASARGPMLTRVHLWECRELSDDVVIAFVHACPNLRSVVFRHSRRLTDRAIVALASCTQLESFGIGGIEGVTSKSLGEVVSKTRLRSLDFDLSTPVEDFDFLSHAKEVEWLRMNVSCTPHPDDALLQLARSNPPLKTLHLLNSAFTDDALAAMCFCTNLHTLGLYRCQKVTSRSLSTLTPRLHELIIVGCEGINQIKDMVKRASDLSTFNLQSDMEMSAEELITLVDECPRLERLTLPSIERIPVDCALRSLSKLKNIRSLRLDLTPFTPSDVMNLISLLPNLRDLHLSETENLSLDYPGWGQRPRPLVRIGEMILE
ncbi:uncharacterized protein VTP21DRAFT_669 [Calcarisporiella thermophila]|uniref:uncharacterized protein n=1 Tax=Calcarisporiella thermophila TaxID=911321 RepID=UPI00374390E8